MSVLLFVIVLVVLIVGHEFGHFIIAKIAKMRVLEFGIGFPPRIAGKKVGETEYTLNWLPFGGFVKILGEDAGVDDLDSMSAKPKVVQAGVIAAGPVMNVVIGFVAFALAFVVGVPQVLDTVPPGTRDVRVVVGQVVTDSPAEAAGIKAGDQVTSVQTNQGRNIDPLTPEALSAAIALAEGPVELFLIRGGENLTVTATPQAGIVTADPQRRALGIATALIGTVSYPWYEAIPRAAVVSWESLVAIVVSLASLIGQAFTFSADLSGIAGPVGIASLTGSAAAFGLGSLLSFVAILSLNLAIVNLLPLPALDGGRIVVIAIEAIRRRALPARFIQGVNTVGFGLLILLMLVVTLNDVTRLVG